MVAKFFIWIMPIVNIPHTLSNGRRMLRAIQNSGSMHEGTTETNGEHTK